MLSKQVTDALLHTHKHKLEREQRHFTDTPQMKDRFKMICASLCDVSLSEKLTEH